MVRDLIFVGPLMFLYLFLTDVVRSEKAHVESEKSCAFVRCDPDAHCVSRKFWCKNPPCPSMIYCSKTPRESMKGPTTCTSVRCSKGHICMVKVRRCRWDQKCRQQIARCVSEREYYEGPASCADFHCPSGHRCILRESLCAYPPCKLLKSCANAKDVQAWHGRCRTLGCPSEYECFLRRPSDDCAAMSNSCKHTPDCVVTDVKDLPVDPECRGWVCPRDQECSATVPDPCSSEDGVQNCRVNRTCRGPLATYDSTSSPSSRLFPWVPTTANLLLRNDYEESDHRPGHRIRQTNASVLEDGHTPTPSQTDCSLSERMVRVKWDVQFEKWNSRNGSIYRTPVYVRSTLNRNRSEAGKSADEEQSPTDHSITQWLDHLRLKTGVDAINVWIKQAEENRKYEFKEWLAAVRSNLGPFRFENWLREIRKITSEYPAFQKWLKTNEENDNGNGTFFNQEQELEAETEPTQETTESPDHGYQTLTNFYPHVVSGNDRLVFSVDQEPPNVPVRKNAGHPRINYGHNRGYKQYRGFYPPELNPAGRVQTQQENAHKIGYLDSPELEEKVEKNPAQDDPVNQLLKFDLKKDENGQRNTSVKNDSTLDSPPLKMQKNVWNDSRTQENAQEYDVKNPLSNAVVRRQENHQEFTNEDEDARFAIGLGNSRLETRDQIRNHNGLDHNALFTKVEDPGRNSSPKRTPEPTVSRQFTEEAKDQRAPFQAVEFPGSIHRQYYQRVYELGHEVPEGLAKLGNSTSDVQTKKDKNLTKTYTPSAPVPEELHIISPWEAVRVFDPEKRTYYSLMGFAPEQADDRLRIIGYPLVVSRASSIDHIADVLPQDAKSLVDIPLDSESNPDPKPWNQAFQYQPIPRRVIPQITQISDHQTLPERKPVIDAINQQQSKHQSQPRPASVPAENWYLWDDRAQLQLPEVGQAPDLPGEPYGPGFADLEESLREYPGSLSSQEYVEAYVNALIEDALSRVILGEQMQEYEGPGDSENSENPNRGSQHTRSSANNGFREEGLGAVQETQFSEEKIFEGQKHDGDPVVYSISQTVQPTRDVLTSENQMMITGTKNSPEDLTVENMDYQYGCEDGDGGQMETELEESSAEEEVEEYYYDDTEQEEYFEGALNHQGEYPEEVETNLTDYDFQYYGDEEMN